MGSEGTMGKAAVIGGDVVVYEEKKGRVRLEERLVGRPSGSPSPRWRSCSVGTSL